MIDAKDNRGIDVLATGRRDDHFLGTTLEMGRGLFLGGEKSGALEHDVDTEFAPGQLRGITVGENANPVTVDDHGIALDRHSAAEATMRSVELRQMRIGLGIAEIVDRNDLQVMLLATFIVGTQDVAADAAIAIDGNAKGHEFLLS